MVDEVILSITHDGLDKKTQTILSDARLTYLDVILGSQGTGVEELWVGRMVKEHLLSSF